MQKIIALRRESLCSPLTCSLIYPFQTYTVPGRPVHQGYATYRACLQANDRRGPSLIILFRLNGARATHTPGLRNLPCPSMPRCQARASSRRRRTADLLSARLSCGAGGAITGSLFYMPYTVQHFFGATSMGATSGCSVTAWRSTESCKRAVGAAEQTTATTAADCAVRESEVRRTQVQDDNIHARCLCEPHAASGCQCPSADCTLTTNAKCAWQRNLLHR